MMIKCRLIAALFQTPEIAGRRVTSMEIQAAQNPTVQLGDCKNPYLHQENQFEKESKLLERDT